VKINRENEQSFGTKYNKLKNASAARFNALSLRLLQSILLKILAHSLIVSPCTSSFTISRRFGSFLNLYRLLVIVQRE